ncbi:hypothetical protein FEP54_00037 [Burkholderia multivorans]|nr:hypothetical protein [Burkholderia multivorans]MDR8921345.1 hypothetical protein [Burkholderia multivorans]MDR8966751.1 hypothetical protein [Burkholderia multivorans]MDR8991737.1 hypothetical protein [Burkholderia multivorans]MDR9022903.1 hypothetical protein [Burkholderia multivorans]
MHRPPSVSAPRIGTLATGKAGDDDGLVEDGEAAVALSSATENRNWPIPAGRRGTCRRPVAQAVGSNCVTLLRPVALA